MPRKATGNKVGRPEKSGLNELQFRAAKLDYPHIEWGVVFSLEIERRPRERISRLPAKQLAKQLRVESRVVQKWRTEDPFYISQLLEWFLEDCRREIVERAASRDVDQTTLAETKDRVERIENIVRDMDRYFEEGWPEGGVVSPIDGKMYATPVSLAIHLQKHKCVPAEMVRELILPSSPQTSPEPKLKK